ncbi:MAG TPA: 4-(cytidine 5'-diphospho)-2-C-methyl-D-erythritol kinase [Elusimicrobiales bacterium]|nr:4-(cytidine 5'-diphospho)-2-C-methyl-D-erythritol kinase [Elusimicrobiales bacterium]
MPTERKITLKAPAKLNLFLEVLRKRPDGYHDLATIFAKISLHDTVTVRRAARGDGISLKIINKSGCELASGSDNLASKAAQLFLEETGLRAPIHITLIKRIPVGAGLGGGSSDAAAALCAMNRLFPKALGKHGTQKLHKLALRLGSDVPFFAQDNVFCIGRGRGERLTPINVGGKLPHIVLVYPGVPVSTKTAYGKLQLSHTLLTENTNLNRFKYKLLQGMAFSDWGALLYNRLETAVLPLCPEVNTLKKRLRQAGHYPALMTGSGSCVFALTPNHLTAAKLLNELRKSGLRGFGVKFLGVTKQWK